MAANFHRLVILLKPIEGRPFICTNTNLRPLSVGGPLDEPLRSLLRPVRPLIENLFAIDRCREIFENVHRTAPGDGASAIRRLLELLAVEYRVAHPSWLAFPAPASRWSPPTIRSDRWMTPFWRRFSRKSAQTCAF